MKCKFEGTTDYWTEQFSRVTGWWCEVFQQRGSDTCMRVEVNGEVFEFN